MTTSSVLIMATTSIVSVCGKAGHGGLRWGSTIRKQIRFPATIRRWTVAPSLPLLPPQYDTNFDTAQCHSGENAIRSSFSVPE
jgi:hypothetical protein